MSNSCNTLNHFFHLPIASVHLQQRPFQCDYCNMAFARKDEQTRHVRIVHLGEKIVKKSSSNKVGCKNEYTKERKGRI